MYARVKQYGKYPLGFIPKDRGEWPKPFTPMIQLVVRRNPRDIFAVSECDKCGSLEILWMSRDRAWILCDKCKDMMTPVWEPIYVKMTGWSGYLMKIPKAMRTNTWDRPVVETKLVPLVNKREFKRRKRWVFDHQSLRARTWSLMVL